MPLFQNSVVSKYSKNQDKTIFAKRWNDFKVHFHNSTIQENIRNSKEEQYQGEFLIDLFVNILGYTKNPQPNFNLTTEYKNVKDSKKADGAILIGDKVRAVIELKGTNTTDLGKIETQAFGYKNNQPDCIYIITSNFEKLRFYIDNAIEYLEFNLFTLSEKEFELLHLCLAYENLSKDIAKIIKEESVSQEDVITKKLYKDYSIFKRELYNNLVVLNPQFEPIELFKKSQKLLDRFLFIFFAEDRNLLPTNLIFRINKEWQNLRLMRIEVSLYDRYKVYFNDLNSGAKVVLPAFSETASKQIEEHQIFAYNGGLFKADEILDNIIIDDALLFKHTENLSNYDFASEVDVNVLGHIFENSLNELDEIKAELEGEQIDNKKTKRKKDGVFYTPKYITKYIVENTLGKLCNAMKIELQLNEEDYITDKKRQKKTLQGLNDKLHCYRNWLLQLTICDPACGSGAFLNQALEFLINEHRYIDELQAKLFGDAMVLSDVEKSILENNLFGVDLNEESVEIAKLSLWLRTAQPNRKLNDLNNNIKCGNSLIDDVTLAGEKAFNWQTEFPQVFAKGGFDVIIGNPPYVSHDRIDNKEYLKKKYLSFSPFGDLYIFFYELSLNIINQNGISSLITSNSFLKAEYGKPLRKLIISLTYIEQVINIENTQIFSDATVNTVILTFSKNKENNVKALVVNSEFNNLDFNEFINKNSYFYLQTDFDELSWNLIKPDILKTRNRIKGNNKTLEDYHTKIRLGIATGDNNAFIIDESKKKEFINLNVKNSELIKPVLRGRDIERYSYTFPNLYVLLTKNGIDVENEYPNIYDYLNSFGEGFKKRGAKGQHWTNLRACSFFEDFKEEKIVWIELTDVGRFSLCTDEIYLLNSAYFLIPPKEFNSKFLLSILNSKVIKFYLRQIANTSGVGTTRWINNYVKDFPIPKIKISEQQNLIVKSENMILFIEDFKQQSQKFQRTIQRKFELESLPKKLQDWYLLSYTDFIKELGKLKIKLTLSEEAEWEDYFTAEATKLRAIKAQIETTDKEIDAMVYELYGLTKEEVAVIENS
ncbi:Eco57I restriction-modification methylase domain-containing protein [Flavobacterium stagni]|uniref:site-specific DNA-methyltransferase (adenine-specific) n=1 Tax=Flavobacterium stagni TaxID=2506421 RepID=A0A4Q1KDC2_9FLAO|nr:N-6 DNA methylase [Flavobacterium stagni]RXR24676.1 restriction endonuclease subunit M [Flavobacterium stagni]